MRTYALSILLWLACSVTAAAMAAVKRRKIQCYERR